ncbi:hypothetical protein RHO12_10780 [Orbus sturtevantii]|uniref:hypothetical protein n=1 Tax=Orbus sturtevantii TaxID=3074109 RepID=UPI00370D925D
MLKKIRLVLLILIAIIWFVTILPYFLVQTDFGTKYINHLLSSYSDKYSINVGHIAHSITNPYEVTLENVTIQDKTQLTTNLSVKKVVIGLKLAHLFNTLSFEYLLLEDGYVTISPTEQSISADFLQLKNISLHYKNPNDDSEISFSNIYGGIKPWSEEVITHRIDSQFNFTIQKANYNNIDIKSIVIQGSQKNNILYLTNLGGNINSGFFTANANILADNSLLINQLKIDKLFFQSKDDLSQLNKKLINLPKIDMRHLSVIDSSINLANFSLEKANLDIKNIIYDHAWQLQQSTLFFNAQSMIFGEQLIDQPLLQWQNDDNQIIIEPALGLWNKGNIKLSANWQNDELTIENIIASGIHYQLPVDWWQKLADLNLPHSMPNQILIKQLTLMPSLIIDTNPAFSFQFTGFEAFGNNIAINSAQDTLQVDGTILVKADSGTLNTIELHKPDLSLNFTPTNTNMSFSTLINQGILEGTASLVSTKQLESLELNSHSIDSQTLALWYLIDNPIKINNFDLKLHGSLEPLSLNGTLQTIDKKYEVKNNQLADY